MQIWNYGICYKFIGIIPHDFTKFLVTKPYHINGFIIVRFYCNNANLAEGYIIAQLKIQVGNYNIFNNSKITFYHQSFTCIHIIYL